MTGPVGYDVSLASAPDWEYDFSCGIREMFETQRPEATVNESLSVLLGVAVHLVINMSMNGALSIAEGKLLLHGTIDEVHERLLGNVAHAAEIPESPHGYEPCVPSTRISSNSNGAALPV